MDKISSSIKLNFVQRKQNLALLILGVLLIAICIWLFVIYANFYQNRYFPKTYVDDLNISGLTIEEAKNKVGEQIKKEIDFNNDSVTLYYHDQQIKETLKDLSIKNNLDEVLAEAFTAGHQGNIFRKVGDVIKNHFKPNEYQVGVSYDQDKIDVMIQNFKSVVDYVGEKPSFIVSGKNVDVIAGEDSNELQENETLQNFNAQIISKSLRNLKQTDLSVEAFVTHPTKALSKEEATSSIARAEKIIDQKLIFSYEYQKVNLDDGDLISFLALPTGFDEAKIIEFIDKLKAEINRQSSDASFIYDKDTLKVTEFVPDKDGLEINDQATKDIIENFLTAIENETITDNSFDLPMQNTKANITLGDTNDLGIKEVIGFGESWYAHSIPNRIYNVSITADRINNYIVKPGNEFSFNKALGEVSEKTGYKSAYVIEAGETKLAAGGGVCQVSSTLFRALLNAGLKITKRLPHAYRVSYYEIGNEPGFDATVYAGETDLRFINDTDNYILINCQSDSDNLYMYCKLYGTSDGRYNEIKDYKKWGQTPALPTIYVPDPSLAPGQLKQIDWAASGIKAEFTNVIYDKDGQVMREDYYYSNYRSWAAKYLQGV